jgi:hypothetical protein
LPYISDYEPFQFNADWPFGGEEVTVGIGVLCSGGTSIVLASDMRGTFRGLSPNDNSGKQWDFAVSYPLVACIAGRFGACQPVIDELNNRLRKDVPADNVHCEHIENAINYARSRTFYRLVDWQMKMAYCVKITDWHTGKIRGKKVNKVVHDELTRFVNSCDLPMEIIVAGFLPDGNIVFYKASRRSAIEASTSPGVYVIGSGGALALEHLNRRGQHLHDGLCSTLLHVSEALDEAQKSPDKTVGRPQSLMIVHRDGRMERLPARARVLLDWKKAYRDRKITTVLDESDAAWTQLKCQLVPYQTRKHQPNN